MHSSPPPKFGNDCKQLGEHPLIIYNFTFIQFYNFHASLNHRANACSCSILNLKCILIRKNAFTCMYHAVGQSQCLLCVYSHQESAPKTINQSINQLIN
jgi:hypothetical protein